MKNSPEISRRRFLQSAVTTAGVATVPVALTGCFGDDDDNDRTAPSTDQPAVEEKVPTDVAFGHGVALGDPLADAVIIWTRATPVDNAAKTAVAVVRYAGE